MSCLSDVSHLKDHFQHILCMVIDLTINLLKINFQYNFLGLVGMSGGGQVNLIFQEPFVGCQSVD
jgi:hypothetical protein